MLVLQCSGHRHRCTDSPRNGGTGCDDSDQRRQFAVSARFDWLLLGGGDDQFGRHRRSVWRWRQRRSGSLVIGCGCTANAAAHDHIAGGGIGGAAAQRKREARTLRVGAERRLGSGQIEGAADTRRLLAGECGAMPMGIVVVVMSATALHVGQQQIDGGCGSIAGRLVARVCLRCFRRLQACIETCTFSIHMN